MEGNWIALPKLLLGLVQSSWSPIADVHQDALPLELGDCVYIFEQFSSQSHPSWFRGYLVSTASFSSNDKTVSVGIFPASAISIRQEIDLPIVSSRPTSPILSKALAGRMEPLQEEQEDEEDALQITLASSPKPGKLPNAMPSKNRQQRISLASLVSEDARRLSFPASVTATHVEESVDGQPIPPLPFLKAADETRAGVQEPLIDEIASAIREWSSLLLKHIHNQDYQLFYKVKAAIEVLHTGRKTLLFGGLSVNEATQLRRQLVEELTEGNRIQNLDVIVRDPTSGLLVFDSTGDNSAASIKMLSLPEIYSQQVKLAQAIPLTPKDLFHQPLANSKTPAATRLFNIHLAFKDLVCNTTFLNGDILEMYFALYSANEARFITEEFCVTYPQASLNDSQDDITHNVSHTTFVDLTKEELDSQLYLVCRMVRNGPLFNSILPRNKNPATYSQSTMSLIMDDTSSTHSKNLLQPHEPTVTPSMLFTIPPTGQQSVRTAFAGAAFDLVNFVKSTGEQKMPVQLRVYSPRVESDFATFHEDLLSNQSSLFEIMDKISHLDLEMALTEADILPDEEAGSISQKLGVVSASSAPRNDLYVKLWSADFSETVAQLNASHASNNRSVRSLSQITSSSSQLKYFETSVEVRDKEGEVIADALFRDSSMKIDKFVSMVHKGAISPTYGELFKVSLPVDRMESAHLYFTFRNRAAGSTTLKRNSIMGLPISSTTNLNSSTGHGVEKPFAYATIPLFSEIEGKAIADGVHQLHLYPSTSAPALDTTSASPFKDQVTIRTFLCSTKMTHDPTLAKLGRWETLKASEIEQVLGQVKYVHPAELEMHMASCLTAIFGILNTDAHNTACFTCLIAVLPLLLNAQAALDDYLRRSFTFKNPSVLFNLVQDCFKNPAATGTRSLLKVLPTLLTIIVQTRQNQKKGAALGSDVTHEQIEATYRKDLLAVFQGLERLITDEDIRNRGTQVIVMQTYVQSLLVAQKEIADVEMTEMVISFVDSIPTTLPIKTHVAKLSLLAALVQSPFFASSDGRLAFMPCLIRWLKPFFKPKLAYNDKQNAATYLEALRFANAIYAAVLHQLHQIVASKTPAPEDWDNVEYAFGLLVTISEAAKEIVSSQFKNLLGEEKAGHGLLPLSLPLPLSSSSVTLKELALTFCTCLTLARQELLVGYFGLLRELDTREGFISNIQSILRFSVDIISEEIWPRQWLTISLCAIKSIFRLISSLSIIMEQEWLPGQDRSFEFEFGLWKSFLVLHMSLIKSNLLTIEDFDSQKRKVVWKLIGDIRGSLSRSFQHLWDSIGWPDRRIFSSSLTRVGGYQVQLGPTIADGIIEMCLSHHDDVRKMATWILFTLLLGEWHLHGSFNEMQTQVVDTLDKIFSLKKGDELSRGAFLVHLRALFDAATIDEGLREIAVMFLESTSTFLELLLGVKDLPEGDEFLDDRIMGTLRLMSFIKRISSSGIFCKYVHRLKNYHNQCSSFTEAGLVLKLHADVYSWRSDSITPAMPEFDLPEQSEFERKERLYVEILQLLDRGQAWESALVLTKELQQQYETQIFAYTRLSETLAHQSLMYLNIVKEKRTYAKSFRVAFYGSSFPKSVQNKQFVYRANPEENLTAFVANQLGKHAAVLLSNDPTLSAEELLRSNATRFLQIIEVTPEPDRSFPIFSNSSVPNAVREYYEHNGTNVFSFKTPVIKPHDDNRQGWSPNAKDDEHTQQYLCTWTEKTLLVCTDAFPTVIKRTQVEEIQTVMISPLETAIEDLRTQIAQLTTLEAKYISTTQSASNPNDLAAKLNELVDPSPHAGVPFYKQVFFNPMYVRGHEEHSAALEELRHTINKLTEIIHSCLLLHGRLCSVDMRSFHATLQKYFIKNFAEEIRRMPPVAVAEHELGVLQTNGLLDLELSPSSSSHEQLPSLSGSHLVKQESKQSRYSTQLVPHDLPAPVKHVNASTSTTSVNTMSLPTVDHTKSAPSILSRLSSAGSIRKTSATNRSSISSRFGSIRRKASQS